MNTTRDLTRYALPSEADAVWSVLAPIFKDRLPMDVRQGPDKHFARFSRLDQAVQQEHVDAADAVATALGKELTRTSARLTITVGGCATDADSKNDASCIDDFIRRFGERALRRAITDEDVAFYRQPAGSPPFDAADYADVIAVMATSPYALYLVEHGTGSEAHSPLSGYELASRLSYHFWQTMPDEQLLTAARAGTLSTEQGYRAEVERIFADARTRASVATFFGEWLENTTLEELDSRLGDKTFDAFRGSFTPGPDLRERMLAEVVDAATYYAFQAPGSYREFFSSRRSFAKTDDLAQIYGVSKWDDKSAPPEWPDSARVGLLARAAYLATGSASTRPIMKGVLIRKALLCDEIGDPPGDAAANPPPLSKTDSTRQVVEKLTSPAQCAACHARIINPLGFATEGFDALGRVRSEQPLFDDNGKKLGVAPVDTTSIPRVDFTNDAPSSGAADVTRLVLESPKPYACFARQYFRFTFGRLEEFAKDGCTLGATARALERDAPMSEVLRDIALSEAFKRRSFE
jgi:hypothetical protein